MTGAWQRGREVTVDGHLFRSMTLGGVEYLPTCILGGFVGRENIQRLFDRSVCARMPVAVAGQFWASAYGKGWVMVPVDEALRALDVMANKARKFRAEYLALVNALRRGFGAPLAAPEPRPVAAPEPEEGTHEAPRRFRGRRVLRSGGRLLTAISTLPVLGPDDKRALLRDVSKRRPIALVTIPAEDLPDGVRAPGPWVEMEALRDLAPDALSRYVDGYLAEEQEAA